MANRGRPNGISAAQLFTHLPLESIRAAWDAAPSLVGVTAGPDHVLVYQNRTSQAIFGSGSLGLPVREAFPQAGPAGEAPFARAFSTGELVDVPGHVVPVRDVAGGEVLLRYVVAPLRDARGLIQGTVLLAVDVTEGARAEQAMARAQLLSNLTARAAAASDAAAGLQALTDALVPDLADLAALYVVREAGGNASPPSGPEAITIAPALLDQGMPPTPPPRQRPSPWEAVLRSGQAILIPVSDGSVGGLDADPSGAAWLAAVDAHSIAIVPVVVAGGLTGALLLLATRERPAYREEDLPFLADVTARAGATITELRIQHRQREVAQELQRALLPQVPQDLPGLQVAACYVPGAAEVEVGGDWWDVHNLGDGRIALGIGDVSGRGLAAAAMMGQARIAMRAAGHARLDPAGVLELLDAHLSDAMLPDRMSDPVPPRFATACYAILEPARHRLRAANAGHLPPLIRGVDGEVRRVELPTGAPLGLLVGGFAEVDLALRSGETLAMFTDGLVESRTQELEDGLSKLADALARLGGAAELQGVADQLVFAMGRRQGQGDDDIALLLARCPG